MGNAPTPQQPKQKHTVYVSASVSYVDGREIHSKQWNVVRLERQQTESGEHFYRWHFRHQPEYSGELTLRKPLQYGIYECPKADQHGRPRKSGIEFQPLHSRTIPYQVLPSAPPTNTTNPCYQQLLYYNSVASNTPFLILLSPTRIFKYNLIEKHWLPVADFFNLSVRHFQACIHENYGKLWLFSPTIFAILDLETNKWNLIKTIHNNPNLRFLRSAQHPNQLILHSAGTISKDTQSKNNYNLSDLNDAVAWKLLNDSGETEHTGLKTHKPSDNGKAIVFNGFGEVGVSLQETSVFYTDYSAFEYEPALQRMLDETQLYVISHAPGNRCNPLLLHDIQVCLHEDGQHWKQTRVHWTQRNMFDDLFDYDVAASEDDDIDGGLIHSHSRWRESYESRVQLMLRSGDRLYRMEIDYNTFSDHYYFGVSYRQCGDDTSECVRCGGECGQIAFHAEHAYHTDWRMVLVKRRFFVLFELSMDRIYCMDFAFSKPKAFVHERRLRIGLKGSPLIEYDEVNANIHLVYQDGQHFCLKSTDLIPIQWFAMELVYGYCREYEAISSVFIPVSLRDLVLSFYA